MKPLLSIVTATRNDVWLLSKTLRSIHTQSYTDVEHIVQDSCSTDCTGSLLNFWMNVSSKKLICNSQLDHSTYDGMNKGVVNCNGAYVCFINSGDCFPSATTLEEIANNIMQSGFPDIIIGIGKVGSRFWVPSCMDTSLVFSSNGFCHQALWVKRDILIKYPFKSDRGLVDSDRFQLMKSLEKGHTLAFLNTVIAERSETKGLSAASWGKDIDIESKEFENIRNQAKHWGIAHKSAQDVVNFNRYCHKCLVPVILELLNNPSICGNGRYSIAISALEALFRPASKKLSEVDSRNIALNALQVITLEGRDDSLRKFLLSKAVHDAISSKQYMQIQKEQTESQYLNNSSMQLQSNYHTSQGKPVVTASRIQPIAILTSFPKRINTLHYVLKTIAAQTLRPKQIILSVGRDEFSSVDDFPLILKETIKKYDVEVVFGDKTANQYDKFLHLPSCVRENEYICMFDDDTIYQSTTLSDLVEKMGNDALKITANRVHLMRLHQDGRVAEYQYWEKEYYTNRCLHLLCPTGVGGVMYPPGFFSKTTLNQQAILETAPYADDLWLKYISRVHDIPVSCASSLRPGTKHGARNNWLVRYIPQMAETALYTTNDLLGLNSKQIDSLDKYFGRPFRNDK
jgi:glycosyltransferase involved in cell wall biosynthesis